MSGFWVSGFWLSVLGVGFGFKVLGANLGNQSAKPTTPFVPKSPQNNPLQTHPQIAYYSAPVL
jgi:hypothetical protein